MLHPSCPSSSCCLIQSDCVKPLLPAPASYPGEDEAWAGGNTERKLTSSDLVLPTMNSKLQTIFLRPDNYFIVLIMVFYVSCHKIFYWLFFSPLMVMGH